MCRSGLPRLRPSGQSKGTARHGPHPHPPSTTADRRQAWDVVATDDVDQAGEARRGEARSASAPSSLRPSSPAPAAAPPAAHPHRRSDDSSAHGRSPRNTSRPQRSACPGTECCAQLRQDGLPPPWRRGPLDTSVDVKLASIFYGLTGAPTKGGAAGCQRRRVARWADDKGEECGGRGGPAAEERSVTGAACRGRRGMGHRPRGAWIGGGALMRRDEF
jgi:hypothetical protein